MPSKRQPAKQRRAAENRAKRAAMAARAEHAAAPRPTTSTRSSSGSGPGAKSAAGSRGGAATAERPAPGLGGGLAGWKAWLGVGPGATRGPGVRAAFYAVIFGVVAAVVVPFLPLATLDDRDEPVPFVFRGLYLEVRTMLAGETVEARSTSLVDAVGPVAFLGSVLPLLIVIGAVVAFRRSGRSTPLTIAMFVMALMLLIPQLSGGFGIYFFPSMIALAFASFQVRRVEMAERMSGEAAAPRSRTKDESTDDELDDADEFEDEFDDEDVDGDDIDADEFDDEDYDEDLEDVDAEVEEVSDEEVSDEEVSDEEYDTLDQDDHTDVQDATDDEAEDEDAKPGR